MPEPTRRPTLACRHRRVFFGSTGASKSPEIGITGLFWKLLRGACRKAVAGGATARSVAAWNVTILLGGGAEFGALWTREDWREAEG